MNWLITLLFFIVFFIQSSLLGETVLEFGKYNKSYEKRLIAGYFAFFLIGYFVYLFAFVLKFNWNIYFITFSAVLGVIDLLLILINHKKIIGLTHLFESFSIKKFIKENWLLLVFVILMISFAIANNVSYLSMNYDDTYYIGKMVNFQETPLFNNEDYFTGALEQSFSVSLERFFNSYEASYAYLAFLFKIRVPFFARISMGIVNYFLVAITYKEISKYVVKEEYAQFPLLAMCSFVLPFGFIQAALKWFCIRSYDLWQFQTAIFYGGSVVRVVSLPVLFIFAFPMIKKMNIRQILVVAGLSLSFLSFSSIFITNFVFFALVIFLVKFVYSFITGCMEKNWKKIVLNIVFIALEVGVLLLTKKLSQLNIPFLYSSSFKESLDSLKEYYVYWYGYDFIIRFGFVPILVSFFLAKRENKTFILFIAILYGMVYTTYFAELLLYSSFNYFFVSLRTIASIQHLVFVLYGMIFAWVCQKLHTTLLPSIATVGYILVLLIIFIFGHNYMLQFSFLGSGIDPSGWTFSRILDVKTNMIPHYATEVGDYFNTLPYDNYVLFSPRLIKEDELEFDSRNFILSSNRIVLVSDDDHGMINEKDFLTLQNYCVGNEGELKDVLDLVDEYNIDYMIVKNKDSIDIFKENGFNVIFDSNGYSLLQTVNK